jgi:hypothetical protein
MITHSLDINMRLLFPKVLVQIMAACDGVSSMESVMLLLVGYQYDDYAKI